MVFQNPWIAENIEAFSFYCCPECDFKSKLSDNFETHALQSHKNSKEFFKNCFQNSWAQSNIHEKSEAEKNELETDMKQNILHDQTSQLSNEVYDDDNTEEYDEFCDEEFVFENEELVEHEKEDTNHRIQG